MEGIEGEDDDPVVRSVPVVLSQELATRLHILQFPLRPVYRPLGPPDKASLQPATGLLRMEHER
jgi:hypothetical protein